MHEIHFLPWTIFCSIFLEFNWSSLLFSTCSFTLFCVAPTASFPSSSLRAYWPHGRVTVSLHYVCAKHQGLHNVKYQNTPPLYQTRVDYCHEKSTYSSLMLQQKKQHFGLLKAVTVVLQHISRVAVKVCPHIVDEGVHLSIVWPYQGKWIVAHLWVIASHWRSAFCQKHLCWMKWQNWSTVLDILSFRKCPEYPTMAKVKDLNRSLWEQIWDKL